MKKEDFTFEEGFSDEIYIKSISIAGSNLAKNIYYHDGNKFLIEIYVDDNHEYYLRVLKDKDLRSQGILIHKSKKQLTKEELITLFEKNQKRVINLIFK